MISEKEILRLAEEAYEEFSVNFLVSVKFEVLPIKKFLKIAEKSEIIKTELETGAIDDIRNIKVPALVVHGDHEKIYFCKLIINKLAARLSKQKQKDFVRAITLHELYHIINKSLVRDLNLYEFVKSEKRVDDELREDYPDLINVLEEVKKRAKNIIMVKKKLTKPKKPKKKIIKKPKKKKAKKPKKAKKSKLVKKKPKKKN